MVGRSPHRGLRLLLLCLLHEVSQGSEHCSRLLHQGSEHCSRLLHRSVLHLPLCLPLLTLRLPLLTLCLPLLTLLAHRGLLLLLSQREPLHWDEHDFHRIRVNSNQMDMEFQTFVEFEHHPHVVGHLEFLECHHCQRLQSCPPAPYQHELHHQHACC